ncbi:MAG: hypothetical protein BMS9Abin29_2289 [Gemmatimonadota bacterium]|nr:MAG: hypothetical protein BMS9Abin29_2289 [Gemmatimonadota bacterium]
MTLRGKEGYVDPIAALLPFMVLIVLFVNPRLVAAISHSPPVGLPRWVGLLALGGLSLIIQGAAITACIVEAHQDAISGGERSGLNRAPALSGMAAPFALTLLYIGGLWPLMRLEPRPNWAIALDVIVALGILGGACVAGMKGRRSADARQG